MIRIVKAGRLFNTHIKSRKNAIIDSTLSSAVFYAFAGSRELQGGAARGNPCKVTLLSEAPVQPPVPDLNTQCLSWRIDEHVYAVRCWSPANSEITLCGHGLLCCGAAWAHMGQTASILEMNGLQADFYADNNDAWIGLPNINCSACRVPLWVGEFFPVPPIRAAEAGGDEGYLVLEWPDDYDLRSLPIPLNALQRRTKRGLIVTCRDTERTTTDIKLRYFAVQHGVPEDTATGSAMRVLSTYWNNRGLGKQLRALQSSTDGGELCSRIHGDLTWIGGRVLQNAAGELYVS